MGSNRNREQNIETDSDSDSDRGTSEAGDRLPRNLREKLLANVRPQPAIPSALVFFLFVLLPVTSQMSNTSPDGVGTWLILMVGAGIVGSCGLAIAAGFCSVFPQVAWFVLAAWCFRFAGSGALPAPNRILLGLGMCAVAVMFLVQFWRINTERFVATVRDAGHDEEDDD